MEKIIKAICPYCQFSNALRTESESQTQRIVITCDSDMGGCDTDFVVEYVFEPQIKTFAIEGFRQEAEKRSQEVKRQIENYKIADRALPY